MSRKRPSTVDPVPGHRPRPGMQCEGWPSPPHCRVGISWMIPLWGNRGNSRTLVLTTPADVAPPGEGATPVPPQNVHRARDAIVGRCPTAAPGGARAPHTPQRAGGTGWGRQPFHAPGCSRRCRDRAWQCRCYIPSPVRHSGAARAEGMSTEGRDGLRDETTRPVGEVRFGTLTRESGKTELFS